jgi:hypothetical protein
MEVRMKRILVGMLALSVAAAGVAHAQHVRVAVGVERPGIRIAAEFGTRPVAVVQPVQRYCEWYDGARYCWDAVPYHAGRPMVVYVDGVRRHRVKRHRKHAHLVVNRWARRAPPPHARAWHRARWAPPPHAVRVVYVR